MSNDTIKVSMNIYDIPIVVEQLNELEQENKQLKEELQKADSITQSCIFEGKEESIINFRECLNKLELYKEVIEEVRDKLYCWGEVLDAEFQQEVLQILDKAKGEENE